MARVQPPRQIARYELSVLPQVNEPFESETVPILPSSSTPKPKAKFPWPNLLWIGLAVLISICLIIVVIVPIIVLANPTNNTTTTICSTTSITTTVTTSSLPNQCNNYTLVTDETRRPSYTTTTSCDFGAFAVMPTWIRFQEPAGTLLATCPMPPYGCGAQFPGWYAGLFPSTAGETTFGFVCYTTDTDWCFDSSHIFVTNCNGYYVFYLRDPPICDMRYCTI